MGQGRDPGPKHDAVFEMGERGPRATSRSFFQDLGAEKDLKDRLCGRHSGDR